MKKLFRKAVSVLGSFALVGATISGAAAAAYPAPFNSGTYAVVYGAAADQAAASTIATGLPSMGTGEIVLGSDSYKFARSSTEFHIGDGLQTIRTTLDNDELPSLLADGIFVDDDNDEFDYTQKISVNNHTLTMFEDNDYIEDEPTIGFKISSGTNVLNYTLTFSDEPNIGDLPTATIPLIGKDYYVLSNSTSGSNIILTLLDSAIDTTLTEGSSSSLSVSGASYDVSIDFISATEVVLNVNGETTNSLAELQTYKLSDGSYVGIKDIRFNSKEGTVSSVEFSIGTGKLKLTSGSEVQINDDAVSGLTSTITNSSVDALTSIRIEWEADNDLFLTGDTDAAMPGFTGVKLSYTGVSFPLEETIQVQQGGDTYATLENFPLKDGPADIDFLYGTGGVFTGIGKDSSNLLITSSGNSLVFDKDTDEYFIVSYASTTEGESYLMRATNFVLDGSTNKTDIQYYKNGGWVTKKSGAKPSDEFSIGNADLGIQAVDRSGKNLNITANSSSTNFYHLYSKEGLRTYLPFTDTTPNNYTASDNVVGLINFNASANKTLGVVGHNLTSFFLNFSEEDKDDNIGSGDNFGVLVGWDSSSTAEVEVSDLSEEDVAIIEIQDTDVWRSFMYSSLATEFLLSKPNSGQDSIKIIYHGDEVAASVYVTSTDAGASGGTTGQKSYMDTESASYAGKNIIVVGGSCVNSVAASLLGGANCGDAFMSATDVGPGKFLIESFNYNGKIATVVAGYEADDTTKAAIYLANAANDVTTNVGDKYVGQSATETAILVS